MTRQRRSQLTLASFVASQVRRSSIVQAGNSNNSSASILACRQSANRDVRTTKVLQASLLVGKVRIGVFA